MRCIRLTLILCCLCCALPAQSKRGFFMTDTAGRKNTLMYGQIGFHIPVASNFCMAGHGIQLSLGVNPAFLFSKKWTIGIFAGLKLRELIGWPGRFNSTFSFDLQNNLQPENGSAHDSVLVSYYAEQTRIRDQLGGISAAQLGFVLGHSGSRYMPLVKIYRSFSAWSVEGYRYDGVYANDFLYLQTRREYGTALSWTLRRLENVRTTLGAYFSRTEFSTLNVEGLWLHEHVTPALASKYEHVWRAGLTISMEFF